MSAFEWFDIGSFYRRSNRFGEAMNAFYAAVEAADAALSCSGYMESGEDGDGNVGDLSPDEKKLWREYAPKLWLP